MIRRFTGWAARARGFATDPVMARLDDQLLATGLAFLAMRDTTKEDRPEAHSWRVFSQFGEDGILDFLIKHAARPVPRYFIEFGVENYRESNTRLLCEKGGWQGLIIDGGRDHIKFARRRRLEAHRGLRCIQAFLTVDNINSVIAAAQAPTEIGVLSVDVDGVDYWLCEALEVASPGIVVVEHNPYFGPTASVSVPYEASFDRRSTHTSGIYYGASITAFYQLWSQRGYRLVGVSPEGLNLFFVREDYCRPGWGIKPVDAYRPASFSPYLGEAGVPSALMGLAQALSPVADFPLVDISSGTTLTVGDLRWTV